VRVTVRTSARLIAVAVGAFAAALIASPAWAHVEVSADLPQAGAQNVTITFHGEAESANAGVVSAQVTLPAGIKPADVTLVSAPNGWQLTRGADNFTVAGTALPVGQDMEFSVKIAQLPWDATQLMFKTLQSYSDGEVDRWIDEPTAGVELEHPAPILKLDPAPSASPPSASQSAAGSPSSSSSAAAPAADSQADSGTPVGVWIGLGAVLLAAIVAAGVIMANRRRSGPSA
jgi:uncharacterized protein YcnI